MAHVLSRFVFRSLLSLSAVTAGGVFAGAAELPAFAGRLSGEVTPLGPQTDFALRWNVTAATSDANERTLRFGLTGPGTVLSADARMRLSENAGPWNITRGEADVAPWWAALGKGKFPALAAITASGRVTLSGTGILRTEPNEIAGELRAALAGAAFAGGNGAWSIDGVNAQIVLPRLPDLATAPQQRLTIAAGAVGALPLKNGFAEFELLSASKLRVRRAGIDALGGTITCEGFDLDLTTLELAVAVRVEGLELSALRPYLPNAVSEVQGRLDGQLRLRWSTARGLELGDGDLRLRSGEPATIRLAPAPGFLSSHVPARFFFAPSWLGPIGRIFSHENPAQETLKSIELGQEALVVESVQAELRPDAEGTGSTAVVRILARPTNPETVKVLRLTVNVSGPLADVVRFGMDGRVSFGGR